MAGERTQRRLAAILAADVVGYSRLMEQDEAGTLASLKQRRKSVLEPLVAEHHGRVVKVMGDGVLIEFASVVDAVACAAELQKRMAMANDGIADDRHIMLRIGINLGDVVVEGADIYGDGVNLAARLEEIAEPGSIVISRKVHDEVGRKLAVSYDDLGEQSFKNIAAPIRVYRVAAPREHAPYPEGLPLPAKPSIAVLPFTNLSTDAEQEFFADGLTEDLIAELSKAPGLFVIARHSCFAFKNKSVDLRRVARELGVRYILEGSARRAAARIRINAQLIDARGGGGHLWAERFDRDLADVFSVQDEVVARIVEALLGKLAVSKLPDRNPPNSLEAYDLCVRGRFLWQRTMVEEGKEARRLFEQAIALDPDYAEAHAYLAWLHWMSWVNWFEAEDPNRRLALEIAQRAVALDPNDAFAHGVLAYVLTYEHEYEESAAQIEAALKVDPNHADIHAMRTDLLVMDGRPLEATESIARALRLNPHPPAWYYWLKGEAEYAAHQYENSAATLHHEATYGTPSRSILAAALAQLGRIEEARLEGRLFMADYPKFRIESFLDTQPFRHRADRELFADGYRKAALPEA
ncbi:MAG: adenylate/guanylate cyclase domain-containing protein [Rhodospirillum sp.]|jgi:TolB-like protein/class 3 adenylate cyclase|nr:adenylate/guanylate cyclase domain-containing protein [Rhodospirillum sp.]